MTLNIATAFRLRNKLKEKISKLSGIINGADVTKPVGTPENTTVFDGSSFNETIERIRLLMSTLRDFNLAIDKANGVNRTDLINLETLKAEIAFYDSVIKKIRQVPPFTYEYNAEGGRDKVQLELLLDQKSIIAHYENLIKQKDSIEEKLTTSNSNTQVSFDRNIIDKLL